MTYANYNFLDQLTDVEIDLSSYLTLFSDDNYTLKFSNIQPVVTNVKNLFSFTNIIKNFKNQAGAFQRYNIEENELPEDVSIKFYGTEDLWWVITLYNDITNPFIQWPLSNDQIDYLSGLYSEKENKYTKEGYKQLFTESSLSRLTIDVLKQDQVIDLVYQLQNAVLTVKDDNSAFEFV